MKLLLLGPVEFVSDGRSIPLGRRRERLVLATLALQAGRAVPIERLAAAAWDGADPPAGARAAIRVSTSRLRKVLAPYGVAISARGDAYLLDLDPTCVDAWQFRAAVGSALAIDEDDARASALRTALDLWRGDVMEDAAPPDVRRALAGDLVELRLVAQQRQLEAQIDSGQHQEAVADLRSLVADHPTHEGLVALLMTALVHGGRSAEALDAYADLRAVLTDQLGADPGPDVAQLHLCILRQASGQDETAARTLAVTEPPIHTLPRGAPAFTGRDDELAALDAAADETAPAPLVIVTGPGGIGKTALSVHWARRAAARFPDGQLFINLRGYGSGQPPSTNEALTQLLLALGEPLMSIPSNVDSAATMLRRRLAGRRMLILIDNAATAAQVRPLLPGSAGCGVVVTSRDSLTGLTAVEGAARVLLGPLSADHSLAVLRHVLGPGRIREEFGAATDLAALCDGLPLALRVAAANLAGRPDASIAAFHADMINGGMLDALQVEGDLTTGVRATLSSSYERLTAPAQRLFRLLGVPAGPDVSVEACGALLNVGVADEVLAELHRAHLLERQPDDRYAMHDLVRAYAIELGHGASDTDDARTRLLDFYQHSARNAAIAAYPNRRYFGNEPAPAGTVMRTFDTTPDALAWLDAEVANLVAEAQRAAADGPWAYAWEVCDALAGYYWLRRHAARWEQTIVAAERAAQAAGDERMAMFVRNRRGIMHWAHTEYDAAERAFVDVAEVAARLGDHRREAAMLGNLGGISRERSRYADARSYSLRALELHVASGSTHYAASCLITLSTLANDMGEPAEALAHARRAEAIYRDLHDAEGTGAALMVAIDAMVKLGRPYAEIDPAYQEALGIYQRVRSMIGQSALLTSVSGAALADGRAVEALDMAERANTYVGPANNPGLRVSALLARGRAHRAMDNREAAWADFELAESESRRLGLPNGAASALNERAGILIADGAIDPARQLALEALALAERPADVATAERIIAATTPKPETSAVSVPAAAKPAPRPRVSRG